jgi:hypothetical protein
MGDYLNQASGNKFFHLAILDWQQMKCPLAHANEQTT